MSAIGTALAYGAQLDSQKPLPPVAPQPNLSAVQVKAAPPGAVMDVRNIVCGYGNSVILHGVSAHLMPRELVTVIGPNGAGKSTLLKASYGLSRVFSGEILINGKNIKALKPYLLADLGVGFVPQLENVFPTLTVFENLRVGALGRKDRRITDDDMERIYQLFPVLRVKRAERAGNLSGGQRQMVALARALIAKPSILLLDEPSAGLSPKARMDVLMKIREIRETGIAIMLVEQNAIQSLKIADRGYILAQGRNVFEGTAREIITNEDIGKMFLGRR
jgi:ABC-type branched-subunit amino acid transport system ATPase component